MITQQDLKELLIYNSLSGAFIWRVHRGSRAVLGGEAGTIHSTGYRHINISRKTYKAHRLAVLYMTGMWPKCVIDHINHVRDDNRWVNLREATHIDNCRNIADSGRNTSGVMGVTWDKRSSKWHASIRVYYKTKHIGYYNCITAAMLARKRAENVYGFHTNHGRTL